MDFFSRKKSGKDRDVLLALYRSTGGGKWHQKSNWNTDAPLQAWHGVRVNSQGRVVKLDLKGNNLQGRIPPEVGNLSALESLFLWENHLSGPIPAELKKLAALTWLDLGNNQLTGPIPPELGKLAALQYLRLQDNQLTGPISPYIGKLRALTHLYLEENQLSGSIPKELGALTKLQHLWLSSNQLTGAIPPELGKVEALECIVLGKNQLIGPIPPELAKLKALEHLDLENNRLTGPIPKEFEALRMLEALRLQGNTITGGPLKGEDLDIWRGRLRKQTSAELDVGKETAIPQRSSSTQSGEPAGRNAAPAGGTSSPEEEEAERLLMEQVDSFAELKNVTRENRKALGGIKLLLGKPTAGSSSSSNEVANEAKLRELDGLIAMAKVLDEMTVRHVKDKDIERKELALLPGPKAYYFIVRSGLCNAYLAASVVASSLVSTSRTGGMGMAGEALKVLCTAVPGVGGLASFTAAALKAGDRHIQTRRVVKITEMASDAVECCSLARTLGLRLSDGLIAGTISTTCKINETLPTMVGVDGGLGRYGWNQGIDGLPDGPNEEAVMEWFSSEMANGEGTNDPKKGSSAEQRGRRLGKRHLQKLLVAVGRGCLQGTNIAEEKVERLLKVIVPEASGRPATTPRAPDKSLVRSSVSARPHDGSSDREAEFAAMKAQFEAFQLADKRRQAELEALRSDNKRLLGEVEAVKTRIPKPRGEQSGWVDAGGGQILSQKQETKTKEELLEGAENTAAVAAAADHHPVTQAQLREFAALQDERHREHDDRHGEHDANYSRLQRGLDAKKDKRRGRG